MPLAPLLLAAALIGSAVSATSAAEVTRFRGIAIDDTEINVRAALAGADCRPIRTQLSRHACSIRTIAWEVPVLAMFVFAGEAERRLVMIALTFEGQDRDRIEQGLRAEYGRPDSVQETERAWRRADAGIWMEGESPRVMFARRDHVERARRAMDMSCDTESPVCPDAKRR